MKISTAISLVLALGYSVNAVILPLSDGTFANLTDATPDGMEFEVANSTVLDELMAADGFPCALMVYKNADCSGGVPKLRNLKKSQNPKCKKCMRTPASAGFKAFRLSGGCPKAEVRARISCSGLVTQKFDIKRHGSTCHDVSITPWGATQACWV